MESWYASIKVPSQHNLAGVMLTVSEEGTSQLLVYAQFLEAETFQHPWSLFVEYEVSILNGDWRAKFERKYKLVDDWIIAKLYFTKTACDYAMGQAYLRFIKWAKVLVVLNKLILILKLGRIKEVEQSPAKTEISHLSKEPSTMV